MTFEEVNLLLEQYNLDYQNQWNQTRWLAYINANVQGCKIKKPTDLVTFSWEQLEIEFIEEDIEIVKERLLNRFSNVLEQV